MLLFAYIKNARYFSSHIDKNTTDSEEYVEKIKKLFQEDFDEEGRKKQQQDESYPNKTIITKGDRSFNEAWKYLYNERKGNKKSAWDQLAWRVMEKEREERIQKLTERWNIASETDIKGQDRGIDITDHLAFRKAAAHLAFTFYEHFLDRNDQIPEVINRWEHICLSEDEFAEIRNQWLCTPTIASSVGEL